MKRLLKWGILLVLVFSLANSNPGMDKYVEWCMVQLNQQFQAEPPGGQIDPLNKIGSAIMKWGLNQFGPDYIRGNTKVSNYVIATLYTTAINEQAFTVLGIMNNFVLVKRSKISK